LRGNISVVEYGGRDFCLKINNKVFSDLLALAGALLFLEKT